MKSFIMKGAICSINETFFSCGHNDNLWVAPSQHKKSNFLNQTELRIQGKQNSKHLESKGEKRL